MPSILMKRMLDYCSVPIEPYSLYPPNVTTLCNREVIRIVTKIDHPQANIATGGGVAQGLPAAKRSFVSALIQVRVPELLEFIKERWGRCSPWEEAKQEDQYI